MTDPHRLAEMLYLLVCLECGDPAEPLPFKSAADRGKWATAHARATGHDRWRVIDEQRQLPDLLTEIEIKARRAKVQWSDALAVVPGWQTLHFPRTEDKAFIAHAPGDIDWLFGEVDRLRDLLARLEWASSISTSGGPQCPACGALKEAGHDPGCELAAVLHPRLREGAMSDPDSEKAP